LTSSGQQKLDGNWTELDANPIFLPDPLSASSATGFESRQLDFRFNCSRKTIFIRAKECRMAQKLFIADFKTQLHGLSLFQFVYPLVSMIAARSKLSKL